MKVGVNKKSLKDFFISYGVLIIFFFLTAYFALAYPISIINGIKDYETISFFFEAYELKENTLEDDLLNLLEEDGVLSINLYQFAKDDELISQQYQARGVYSDFVMLTESDLDTMFEDYQEGEYPDDYISLDEGLAEDLGLDDTYDYYYVGGARYAFKAYDKDDESYNEAHNFTSLLSFVREGKEEEAESTYFLFPSSSVNMLPYDEDSLTSNGVKAMQYFLSIYGEKQ